MYFKYLLNRGYGSVKRSKLPSALTKMKEGKKEEKEKGIRTGWFTYRGNMGFEYSRAR